MFHKKFQNAINYGGTLFYKRSSKRIPFLLSPHPPIHPEPHLFHPAGLDEGGDIVVGGAAAKAELGADGEGVGAAEVIGEQGEDGFLCAFRYGGGTGVCGLTDDAEGADGIDEQDFDDGHGEFEVAVGAGHLGGEVVAVDSSHGREGHGDAEHDESEAADGGQENVAVDGGEVVVLALEEGVEPLHLGGSESEGGVFAALHSEVEGVYHGLEFARELAARVPCLAEGVAPLGYHGDVPEDDA